MSEQENPNISGETQIYQAALSRYYDIVSSRVAWSHYTVSVFRPDNEHNDEIIFVQIIGGQGALLIFQYGSPDRLRVTKLGKVWREDRPHSYTRTDQLFILENLYHFRDDVNKQALPVGTSNELNLGMINQRTEEVARWVPLAPEIVKSNYSQQGSL